MWARYQWVGRISFLWAKEYHKDLDRWSYRDDDQKDNHESGWATNVVASVEVSCSMGSICFHVVPIMKITKFGNSGLKIFFKRKVLRWSHNKMLRRIEGFFWLDVVWRATSSNRSLEGRMRKHLYSPPEFSTKRLKDFRKKLNIEQSFNQSLIHPFYTLVT